MDLTITVLLPNELKAESRVKRTRALQIGWAENNAFHSERGDPDGLPSSEGG